jgi:hypothetical protein
MSVRKLVSEQRRTVKQCICSAAAAVSLLMTPLPTSATESILPTLPASEPVQVPLVEWDLPQGVDFQPGAIVVDSQGHDKSRVWFVTRFGAPAKVYRFDPAKSLLKGQANWTSYELANDGSFSGGLRKIRPSYDRRYVFVRTSSLLQRIDTQNCGYGFPTTCTRTMWADQEATSLNVSDVAIDDQNHVFTTFAPMLDPLGLGGDSYLQMVTPIAAPLTPVQTAVKRWTVGGGAGFCPGAGVSAPCLSGIAVHPSNNRLVYYSEPQGNNIGELDVYTNQRQLHVTRWGKIWVVTGSGHLVSLDPYTNKMTRHAIPLGALNDPFGVAPDDDVIGYSASGSDKIGMLHPKGNAVFVPPTCATVIPITVYIQVSSAQAPVDTGCSPPVRVTVDGTITRQADGTFVEANLASGTRSDNTAADSFTPLGITPNKGKAEGTFFYAVGVTGRATNRIGFARLQLKEKVKHPREDDDPDDGDDDHQNHDAPDGHHGHKHHRHGENDWDDDGLDDKYDDHRAQDNVDTRDDAPLAAGQVAQYTVVTSATSLALIATATADPLSTIGLDVYGPTGLFVATAPPTPGLAAATVLLPAPGIYTVKIKNYGLASIVSTPMFIVREPALP